MKKQKNTGNLHNLSKQTEPHDTSSNKQHINTSHPETEEPSETFQTENPDIMEQIHSAKELGQG